MSGVKGRGKKLKRRNRVVIKKIKTPYFPAQKKWKVHENFQNVVEFIKDLGDEDLSVRLLESTNQAMFLLTMSKDEFTMYLRNFLEEGFLSP